MRSNMSTSPITATALKRTLDAHAKGTLAHDIITFGPSSKSVNGCFFYNTTIATITPKGAVAKNYGFFTFSDTIIASGPPMKGDTKDKRNRMGQEYKASMGVALADLGEFGTQWARLDEYWIKEVEKQSTAGKIKVAKREVHALYYKVYGPSHEKSGELVNRPMITLKVPIGANYSDKHPITALRGKPQVTVLDGRKPIADENGKITSYEPYVYVDETGTEGSVTTDNIHKVLTTGTTIVHAVFTGTGAAAATSTFSLPWTLYTVVIIPPESNIPLFGAEEEEEEEETKQPPKPSDQTNSTATAVPAGETASEEEESA
jgi:hypothetical protein